MLKIPFWTPIHKLLVKNQKLIKNLFFLGYISSIVLVFAGFYFFTSMPLLYSVFFKLANKFGTIALLLFMLSFVPGVLQRFKIFPLFTASLVLFRRQIGILMYFFAVLHSMYIYTIPAIMTNKLGLENLSLGVLIGILTLTILFPVWLTSNDFFQVKLGKLWKVTQRVSYFALITLFLHMIYVGHDVPVLLVILSILIVASWIKVWTVKKKKIKNHQH